MKIFISTPFRARTHSMQTCQNSHATHMRMQQDSPHGFQRARPFCNNNRQACHLPRAYCAKRVLGYSSLSSSSLNSFIVFVAKIETHNFSEENGGGRIEKRRGLWCFIPLEKLTGALAYQQAPFLRLCLPYPRMEFLRSRMNFLRSIFWVVLGLH